MFDTGWGIGESVLILVAAAIGSLPQGLLLVNAAVLAVSCEPIVIPYAPGSDAWRAHALWLAVFREVVRLFLGLVREAFRGRAKLVT